MALRFCESFDHLALADIGAKWQGVAGVPQSGVELVSGRHGSAWSWGGNSTAHIERTIGGHGTWILGAAFRFTNIPNHPQLLNLFRLVDGTTIHAELGIPAGSNVLRVYRAGTTLGTGTDSLSANVWYFIEFKVVIDDSGSYHVRINGVDAAGFGTFPVAADTRNAGSGTADRVRLAQTANNSTNNDYHIDDFYACDGSGSVNNDFLGDVRVEALFPNGNGNSSQWVGSDADSTDNYLLVDEAAPNSDTDYVQGSTVGDKDTYAFTNPSPGTGTVHGLQILPYARKTDAGARSIVSVARHSATEVDSANTALSTSYLYYPDIRETKPGGGAWSLSDVSGAEFGAKVSV